MAKDQKAKRVLSMPKRLIVADNGSVERTLMLRDLEQAVSRGLKAVERRERRADNYRRYVDRYKVMTGLLGREDEDCIIRSKGSAALLIKFRRERRGIYFQYVHSFQVMVAGVQRDRVDLESSSLFGIHSTTLRLVCYVAGLKLAGFLHLLRIRSAHQVTDYCLDRALPLIYPVDAYA